MRLSTDTRNSMSKKEFADPSNRKYPINDKQHALQAYRYFLRPSNHGKYNSDERLNVWSKIVKANKQYGNNISRTQLPGGDNMDELESAASSLLDDYLSIEKAANEILDDRFCIEKAAEELLNDYFSIEIAAEEYIAEFEKGAFSVPMGLRKGVGALAIGTGLIGSMSGAASQVGRISTAATPVANVAKIPSAAKPIMPAAPQGFGDGLAMLGQGAKLLKRKSLTPSLPAPPSYNISFKSPTMPSMTAIASEYTDEIEKNASK